MMSKMMSKMKLRCSGEATIQCIDEPLVVILGARRHDSVRELGLGCVTGVSSHVPTV